MTPEEIISADYKTNHQGREYSRGFATWQDWACQMVGVMNVEQ